MRDYKITPYLVALHKEKKDKPEKNDIEMHPSSDPRPDNKFVKIMKKNDQV